MVHIDKDFSNPPKGLADKKWGKIKRNVLTEKNSHKAIDECYRDTTLKTLTKLYYNKCACCERSRGEELEVDHYRPKKTRSSKINPEFNHPGYYWLTYEWSNLMPLCSNCNKAKSNYFPLKDNSKRISEHTYQSAYNIFELQSAEEPLFVHPEIDKQPQKHFLYHSNGDVTGRTEEGNAMVHFYKMNSPQKVRDRKRLLNQYIHDIGKAISRHKTNNDIIFFRGSLETTFSNIRERRQKKHELSLLHIFIYQYFDEFIAKKLPNEYRDIIFNYFKDFKRNDRP